MADLDRRGASTLYAQVEEALLERLRRDYRPGQLFPTQKELAAEFGTSLITVKRALDEIARQGYLQSTRGRGTVVVRPAVRDDLPGIARVHVESWRTTYAGLMPPDYLAGLRV